MKQNIQKIKTPRGKFYVYTLARPDGTVFYVGKGRGKRVDAHEQEAIEGCACPKCSVILSIWGDGGSVIKSIVFETSEEKSAFDHERQLIKAIGRDNLCNRSDGGEGKARVTYMTIYRECKADIRELRRRARRAGYYEYFALQKEAERKEAELERWLEAAKTTTEDMRAFCIENGLPYEFLGRIKRPW